jgi:hypothetical protein
MSVLSRDNMSIYIVIVRKRLPFKSIAGHSNDIYSIIELYLAAFDVVLIH